MFDFPKNLYTDVRIETKNRTVISFENHKLKKNTISNEKGAFIRVFDGEMWYYSAVTDIKNIQKKIDELALLANAKKNIYDSEVIKKMEVNIGNRLTYENRSILKIPNDIKLKLIESYLPLFMEFKEIPRFKLDYIDNHIVKKIISSKGTHITFDIQNATIVGDYIISINGKIDSGKESIYETEFAKLFHRQDYFINKIKRDIDYTKNSVPVKSGVYTCILSPKVSGVFAHESFGHKSEADFMIGDETMIKQWNIGSKVGTEILNIIDTGKIQGSGYVPYDDEGNEAKDTYLIKNGILNARLHCSYTAGVLGEEITSNARAVNFEYEPIVRMTTTYIGSGDLTKDELFKGVKKGIYIEDFKSGSGMSTFTIVPSRAYMIRDGRIAEPIKISVISGNVISTLKEIDGLSKEVEIISSGTGGCGKMEQYQLPVAMGGPYVRVNGINVE